MGSIAPIQEVTRILRILLETQMEMIGVEISSAPLDLLSDQKVKRINLYLYELKENPGIRNQPIPNTNSPVTPSPLPLNLNYLLTPFLKTIEYDKDYDIKIQELLSNAINVFHNNSLIKIPTDLQNQIESLRILLNPLDTKELIEIWKGFKVPYRLSVAYSVTAVFKNNHIKS